VRVLGDVLRGVDLAGRHVHRSQPIEHLLDRLRRGPGFDRSVGLQADIGAYERQLTDDEIFYDGME